MNTHNHSFLTAPSRALSHFGHYASDSTNLTGLSPSRTVSLDRVSVAETTTVPHANFQREVEAHYAENLKSLKGEIKALEKQGKDPEKIKEILKAKKAELFLDAFNKALKNNSRMLTGPQATYTDMVNSSAPGVKTKIDAIYAALETTFEVKVDTAVDDYVKERNLATGRTTSALAAIPPATAPIDFDKTNPAQLDLEQRRAARQQTIDKSRERRSTLVVDESGNYAVTTAQIDAMTHPDTGRIDDYDDGWNPLEKTDDIHNPTRDRLRGFLYANYIFNGGGEVVGMQSVNAAVEKAYKLYHSRLGDSRFTADHLESGLGLAPFFKLIKEKNYSKYDRPIGVMAGMLRLIEENIKNNAEREAYRKHVLGVFESLKSGSAANNEEEQLKILFGIKSRAEFMNLNPGWKNAFDQADLLTDPDHKGALIDDYPGTFGANKDNKTRHQFTGYLYSFHLFHGERPGVMDAEYRRVASDIYDNNSRYIGDKVLEQEYMEQPNNDKANGLDLGKYLREAGNKTNSDKVKGVFAGLMKQAEDLSGNKTSITAKRDAYQQEISRIFDLIDKSEDEDAQLMKLSTIKSPEVFFKEKAENMHLEILHLMVEASKQHRDFKFTPAFITGLEPAPGAPALDFVDYENKSKEAVDEMRKFIDKHADDAKIDLDNKFKVLTDNNAKLRKPLFYPNDLATRRQAIQDTDKKFDGARIATSVVRLNQAVQDGKYLEKLTSAEKDYMDLVRELEKMNREVRDGDKDEGKKKNLGRSARGIGAGPGSPDGDMDRDDIPETPRRDTDYYTEHWKEAVPVKPKYYETFVGKLLASTTDPKQGVIAYKAVHHRGEPDGAIRAAELKNNTVVDRRSDDVQAGGLSVDGFIFIRVHYQGNPVWIPEAQLFPEEQKAAQTAANTSPDVPVLPLDGTPSEAANTDKFTNEWSAGSTKEFDTMPTPGILHAKGKVTGGKINIRNEKGEILEAIPDKAVLQRTQSNIDAKIREVRTVSFIQVTYKNKPVWISDQVVE